MTCLRRMSLEGSPSLLQRPGHISPIGKEIAMCSKGQTCRKPTELKGKPQDCSAEQVRKCHGNVKEHPCAAPAKRK